MAPFCLLLLLLGLAGAVAGPQRDALESFFRTTGGEAWTQNEGWLGEGDECEWFGVGCDDNATVTKLQLNSSNIVGPLQALAPLTNLTELNLWGNTISGDLSPLSSLNSLTYLDVGSNDLSGDLNPLASLTSLTNLRVGSNALSGDLNPLASLTSLTFLDVGSNALSGDLIPLASLTSLTTLGVANNRFTGSVPPSLLTTCATADCYITPNPFMCGDHERIMGTFCAPCSSCGAAGTGECESNFDSSNYLCGSCSAGNFEAGGTCVSCATASFTSWKFLVVGASVVLIVGGATRLLVHRGIVTLPKLRLDLKMQIRVKQLGAVFQMLQFLVALSLAYPAWLSTIVSVLDFVSLPVSVNAPCVQGLSNVPRWGQGFASFAAFYLLVGLVLHARQILSRCFPSIPTKVYVSLQVVAAIFVTQSAAVLLPMSINLEQMIGNGVMDFTACPTLEACVPVVYAFFADIGGQLVVCAVIASFTVLLVHHAHTVYLREREAFLQGGADGISLEEQVDRLLPFWSTFCISYVPRSANFESKALRRRILCFLLPMGCRTAATGVVALQGADPNFLGGSLRFLPAIEDANNVPLVGACMETLSFVLLNVFFLRHQLDRPYVSQRLSSMHADPMNDSEIMTTRVLCWGSAVFLLRFVLKAKIGEAPAKAIASTLAVILLAALALSQRPLFRGLVEDARQSLGSFGGGVGRARGNSAEKDIGVSAKIEAMMHCKNAVEMWKLQRSLRGPLLLASEKPRWEPKEKRKPWSRCRRVLTVLGVIPGVVLLAIAIFASTWALSASDAGAYVVLILVWLTVSGMEYYRLQNQAVGEERESMKSYALRQIKWRWRAGGLGGEAGEEQAGEFVMNNPLAKTKGRSETADDQI